MVSLCDDLLRLTRSYLDYAGIVQGSRPLCLGSFTIGALIDEIDRQFAPVAAARQIKWESHAESPEIVVVTDASRCQQIFGNLVSNAMKYTPVGRAGARGWESGGRFVVGRSSPTQGQAFPPKPSTGCSSRSSAWPATSIPVIEGSGLGLAICRELVTQLQGEISLNSVVGQGTSISVRFPIVAPLG